MGSAVYTPAHGEGRRAYSGHTFILLPETKFLVIVIATHIVTGSIPGCSSFAFCFFLLLPSAFWLTFFFLPKLRQVHQYQLAGCVERHSKHDKTHRSAAPNPFDLARRHQTHVLIRNFCLGPSAGMNPARFHIVRGLEPFGELATWPSGWHFSRTKKSRFSPAVVGESVRPTRTDCRSSQPLKHLTQLLSSAGLLACRIAAEAGLQNNNETGSRTTPPPRPLRRPSLLQGIEHRTARLSVPADRQGSSCPPLRWPSCSTRPVHGLFFWSGG